jgi:hypothetical protein
VIGVLEAARRSATEGRTVEVTSTFEPRQEKVDVGAG